MKRQKIYEEGAYQIWSGSTKNKGLFLVLWKGFEFKRARSMWEAKSAIAEHKATHGYNDAVRKDNAEWMDKMFGKSR